MAVTLVDWDVEGCSPSDNNIVELPDVRGGTQLERQQYGIHRVRTRYDVLSACLEEYQVSPTHRYRAGKGG